MIVLITYNDTLRQGLLSFLQNRDYSVHVPEHRQNAMAMVQARKPKVIVLDMYNIEPNGLTFLKNLRAWGYSGKIIVLNGHSNRMITPGILRQKVDKIICFSPSQSPEPLMDQIEQTIRGLFRKDIEQRAFERYLERGRNSGNDWDDWFKAETEILKSHPSMR
ncbi:MAG: response regulator [Nitrospirales bacterium]|nr:response regulator [Nitrospirales bacterium]